MRCAIFRPKMLHLPLPLNFFVTNRYYYFHLLIGPFHCAKFKKILLADPELLGCTIFRTKMVHLPQFFFWKLLCKIIVQNSSLSSCKSLKKFFQRIQSYEDATVLGPIPQMRIFFRKPVNEPVSFIHACLHAKNQSQTSFYQWNIDDYRILKSHWPRAIFGYNLRTIFFPSMQLSQNVNES